MSPSSLCVPTPYRHNLSDLVFYQAVLYSLISAAIAVGARSDGQVLTFQDPPIEITEIIAYFFNSSIISLLAALFALFAKERLSGFLLRDGGPSIDRSAPGPAQQQVYILKTWPYRYLIKASQGLLQTAFLFPVIGFAQRLWSWSLGVMFFLGILVVPALAGYALIFDDF